MELWLILVATICLCASLRAILSPLVHTKKLPPGPPTIPILGNFLWLIRSSKNFSSIEPILGQLRAKYGPIVTLQIGSSPAIFISSHDLAHKSLVQGGAAFASRPPALENSKIVFSNQHTVTTAAYGPLWRVLRQNLMGLIHPTKLHLYARGRKWSLDMLRKNLHAESASGEAVVVLDHFKDAMYALLLYMCFGEELDEALVRKIVQVQRATLSNFIRFNILNFMPRLGKILFRKLWKELLEIRRDQENIMMPLINKARQERRRKSTTVDDQGNELFVPYVDACLELQVPGEERKFSDGELVSLTSEFINAGTDTSVATLQWIMANMVKYQHIQERLVEEINAVVKPGEEIREEHLRRMPYLRAIVLETLRRHPPAHFILPRAVIEDTKLEGYDIPSNAIVNFTVAEMARDPRVWDEPLEFKPERFLRDGREPSEFDIKGVRKIEMMPFGAGRRVCPAITMALLHQEYYVANLVRDFKWTPEGGEEVDMSEVQDFTIVMKKPLRARLTPRTF